MLKDQLRKQARLRRVDLAKAVGIQFGANLVDQFFLNFAKETLTPGTNIAGYWPIFSEADAKPLLNALHQKACPLKENQPINAVPLNSQYIPLLLY